MCGGISFDGILGVQIFGSKTGRSGGAPRMRDGDGDGKCQEENGKWVPCPPGVTNGSVIDGTGRALRQIGTPIGERAKPSRATRRTRKPAYSVTKVREKEAQKSQAIADAAQKGISDEQREAARSIPDLLDDLANRPRSERGEIRRELLTAINTMFTHEFVAKDGRRYRTEVTDVNISRGDGFSIDMTIFDAQGREIGWLNRFFDQNEKSIKHEEMKIHEDKHKGLGIGSIINGRNEVLYREMGVTTIWLSGLSTTAGYKGATHWPRQGYNWDKPADKAEFLSTIKAAIRRYKQAQTPSPDTNPADAALFESMEQADDLMRLLQEAAGQDFRSTTAITAGDLLDWPGAETWFQRARGNFGFRKNL